MNKTVARILIFAMWATFIAIGLFEAGATGVVEMPVLLQRLAGIALIIASLESIARTLRSPSSAALHLNTEERDRLRKACAENTAATERVRRIIESLDADDDQT